MSHLDLITKETPDKERIIHEGFDFIQFWLERESLDIFEILTLYREYRQNLIINK